MRLELIRGLTFLSKTVEIRPADNVDYIASRQLMSKLSQVNTRHSHASMYRSRHDDKQAYQSMNNSA